MKYYSYGICLAIALMLQISMAEVCKENEKEFLKQYETLLNKLIDVSEVAATDTLSQISKANISIHLETYLKVLKEYRKENPTNISSSIKVYQDYERAKDEIDKHYGKKEYEEYRDAMGKVSEKYAPQIKKMAENIEATETFKANFPNRKTNVEDVYKRMLEISEKCTQKNNSMDFARFG